MALKLLKKFQEFCPDLMMSFQNYSQEKTKTGEVVVTYLMRTIILGIFFYRRAGTS